MSDELFNISLNGDLMLRLYELARKYREYDASQEAVIEFALDYVEDDEDFHKFLRKRLEQAAIYRKAEDIREEKALKDRLDEYEKNTDSHQQ
jgi:Cft2 family RNA processing exonuclease